MTQMTLTKTRLANGIWQGELTGAGETEPQLRVTHQGEAVPGLNLEHDNALNTWYVSVPIPAAVISDGLQTFVISDDQGQTLASFALLAGDALAEDLRAEMDLLRSELDLLKKAFRLHCQDT
jgi:hypothetical protein